MCAAYNCTDTGHADSSSMKMSNGTTQSTRSSED